MGQKKGDEDAVRISIRLDRDVLRRARRIEEAVLGPPGPRRSRDDGLRVLHEALLRGLDLLEAKPRS